MNQPAPLAVVRSLLLLFISLLAFPTGARADETILRARVAVLERENDQLKAEAEKLRADNASLRQEIRSLRAKADSTPRLQPLQIAPEPQSRAAYWITSSSGKRHNAKCRYFQNSQGRVCGPSDGIPCKLCGG